MSKKAKSAAVFVAAVMAGGVALSGAGTAVAEDTTVLPTFTATVPEPPRSVGAGIYEYDPTGRTISVFWSDSTSNGGAPITRYVVTMTNSDRTCSIDMTYVNNECFFNDLERGTRYTFRVTAINAIGKSLPSELTEPVMVWARPKLESVVPRKGRVKVAWSSDDDPAIGSFQVWSKPAGAQCTAPSQARACVIRGLKKGRTYRFYVTRNTYPISLSSRLSKKVTVR